MEELQEIGTRKYNVMINKKYLVGFKEVESKRGIGSYSNGAFDSLSAIPPTDIIVTSLDKEEAILIDGKINLKSIMTKLLSDWNYKFYNIEIIELGADDYGRYKRKNS